MGDWLIVEQKRAINVGRLYGEFRAWLSTTGTKASVALETLKSHADAYEQLNGRVVGASESERRAFRVIEGLGITTATPLLLWLFIQEESRLSRLDRERAVLAIESFVVRRMAAKGQTRAYMQAFVEALRAADRNSLAPADGLIAALRAGPHGYVWPGIAELRRSFRDVRYYGAGGINQARLRLILGRVDEVLQGDARKSEHLQVNYEGLQVEHVIPQNWNEHWPIRSHDEVVRQAEKQERETHLHRIGNLTLISGPLNASSGNDPWAAKREALRAHSHLRLNAELVKNADWTEEKIRQRGEWLAEQMERVWPGPESDRW